MFPTTVEADIFPSMYVSNSITTIHVECVALLTRSTN